ncbi:aminotransferase class V-fold PLP-dependent enzyme [Actinocorallia lasiicapitis]
MSLPERPRPTAELLAELDRLRTADVPVRGGSVTAYVYDTGRHEIHDAAAQAHLAMMEVNCLDPTAFPSIVALERAMVGAVADLLGGDSTTRGIFTSGGTESIMLAVKAARDSRPVEGTPQIVAPTTVHPAFHKAAHYLGVELVAVPADQQTYRADPAELAAAITPRTVLVVASAPSYPHGVADPVAAIAAVAADAGVLCHVDACVGGWVLPWLRQTGRDVAPFDLSVPGVTSISCDLHKYGYAPKGASVVLFADERLRRAAYFASANWPGYPILNATVQSSRSAGPLAAAWATFQAIGADDYRRLAEEPMHATDRLIEAVADIPGLRVLGSPDSPLVAIASDDPSLNVFTIADEARKLGWFFQTQLSFDTSPANLHFTMTSVSDLRIDEMTKALATATAAARASGPPAVPDDLITALSTLDLTTLTEADFASLVTATGLSPSETPEMAPVNTLLNALPPTTRETLLLHFLAYLYTPQPPTFTQ